MGKALMPSPQSCRVYTLNDPTPATDRFWWNLDLSMSFWPDRSIEWLVEDAEIMTDIHIRQNIYCFFHGRSFSADGKCPCEGHLGGVHLCANDDPRLADRPPVTPRHKGFRHQYE